MLSRIFKTGQTFGETCRYVCRDQERAELLAVEGVRESSLERMIADFEWQHALAREKEKPVFHGVLSFPHGEDPGEEKMVEIARRYLEEIRMRDTQYALVKHTDKEHLHVHIVANRVGNDGKIIGEGLIIERGIKAARKLTEEFHLRLDHGKDLGQTNREALHKPDALRYQLYESIREVLPGSRSLEEVEMKLMQKGIGMRYRVDGRSGERQGVSFKIGDYCFQGGRVDRAFTLRGLEKRLALQESLVPREEIAQREVIAQREALGRMEGERALGVKEVLLRREDLIGEGDLERKAVLERKEDLIEDEWMKAGRQPQVKDQEVEDGMEELKQEERLERRPRLRL